MKTGAVSLSVCIQDCELKQCRNALHPGDMVITLYYSWSDITKSCYFVYERKCKCIREWEEGKCLHLVFQGAKISFLPLNSLESSLSHHHGFFFFYLPWGGEHLFLTVTDFFVLELISLQYLSTAQEMGSASAECVSVSPTSLAAPAIVPWILHHVWHLMGRFAMEEEPVNVAPVTVQIPNSKAPHVKRVRLASVSVQSTSTYLENQVPASVQFEFVMCEDF